MTSAPIETATDLTRDDEARPSPGGAGFALSAPLIPVEAARITLSDRRTQRRWQVDLGPYRIAAHQVTLAEYASVPRTPAGAKPDSVVIPPRDDTAASAPGGPAVVPPASDPRLPVTGVSWWDTVRFCNALSEREGLEPAYRLDGDGAEWNITADGYRLPTEAEWEHACRAGTTGPRYGRLDEIAWYRDNSDERLHSVGGKLPNAWGLHDMLGNAWDWCWDLYDPEVYGTYRVLRGGGWFDEHWSCRASVRRRSHPTFQVDDVGFRLARSVLS